MADPLGASVPAITATTTDPNTTPAMSKRRSITRRSVIPVATVTAVSRSPPPSGSTADSGEFTWVIGTVASGTPPKGHDHRNHSYKTKPAGRSRSRESPLPAATATSPYPAPKTKKTNTYPAAVRSNIHSSPMASQTRPAAHPEKNRLRFVAPSQRKSKRAKPAKASGHQPHGGSENAMSKPARPPRSTELTVRIATVWPVSVRSDTFTHRAIVPIEQY